MTITIHHGDSRDVLKTLADCSVDSCVTDPPYALVSINKRFGADNAAPAKSEGATGVYARASAGFMGQKWDTGSTAHDPDFWREVYRVLKPGAHVVAFAGTRTYHRLAPTIEDAGFEIRDMVAWLYGSGFPKSHDVSRGIDKAAGVERAIVGDGPFAGRKPNGSAGVSSVGLSASPGHKITVPATDEAAAWEGWGTALKPALEPIVLARKPLIGTVAANVLAHGVGALNVEGCRVGDDVTVTVRNGDSGGNGAFGRDERVFRRENPPGRWPANVCHDGSDEVLAGFPETPGSSGGTGASTADNDSLGNAFQTKAGHPVTRFENPGGSAARFFYTAKADAEDRLGSKHPTVKPVGLMRWLCRLVTSPGGLILDPFAGTGTTGLAAIGEGFSAILIEREAEYVTDAERRLAWARGEGPLTSELTRRRRAPTMDWGLFPPENTE